MQNGCHTFSATRCSAILDHSGPSTTQTLQTISVGTRSRGEPIGTQKTKASNGDQKSRSRGEPIGTQKTEAGNGDQKSRSRAEPIGIQNTEASNGDQCTFEVDWRQNHVSIVFRIRRPHRGQHAVIVCLGMGSHIRYFRYCFRHRLGESYISGLVDGTNPINHAGWLAGWLAFGCKNLSTMMAWLAGSILAGWQHALVDGKNPINHAGLAGSEAFGWHGFQIGQGHFEGLGDTK